MIHGTNQGILEKDVTPEMGWLRSKSNSYALARKVFLGKAGRVKQAQTENVNVGPVDYCRLPYHSLIERFQMAW